MRVFDAETGKECGRQCWHVKTARSEPSWASVDAQTNCVVNYGEEAWRSVGYVAADEKGMPVWVPVEAVEGEGGGRDNEMGRRIRERPRKF